MRMALRLLLPRQRIVSVVSGLTIRRYHDYIRYATSGMEQFHFAAVLDTDTLTRRRSASTFIIGKGHWSCLFSWHQKVGCVAVLENDRR